MGFFLLQMRWIFCSALPEPAAASIDSHGRLRRRSRAAEKIGIRGCPSVRFPSKSATSESGQGIPTSGQSIPTSGQSIPTSGQGILTSGQNIPTSGQGILTSGQTCCRRQKLESTIPN